MKTKDYLLDCWVSRDKGSTEFSIFFWKSRPTNDNGYFYSDRVAKLLGFISYPLFVSLYGPLRKGRCVKLSSIRKGK